MQSEIARRIVAKVLHILMCFISRYSLSDGYVNVKAC